MVKPILQTYPVVAAADEAEREALRPLGRNADRYNQTVHGLTDVVKAADTLGFWGMASVEHHFHSEGYEVGPNPGLLNAYWAAVTERIRIGQLGYTMSSQNPLRVAEDTAMLDHLAQGRSFVGFSRGYQARWTNTLGQHYGSRATLSPEGKSAEDREAMGAEMLARQTEEDRVNREVTEEHIEMVKAAWTQDSIDHNSKRWQVPFPYAEGTEWLMRDTTSKLGAPGEIGPDGNVHRLSVCPSPYTKPHPPVFLASNATLETVEYCGRNGFIPTYFSGIGTAGKFGQAYVDNAKAAGFDFALGQNQALVRWIQIADTHEEARQAVSDYDVEIYRNLYKSLTPMMKYDESDPVGSVLSSGLWMVGTPEEVRNQFIEQWSELPAEYMVHITHYAQEPTESVIRNMSLFMEHVKPALDELTKYETAAAV